MKQVSKLLLSLALVGLSVPAMADSFWNHNGSVMRLSGRSTDRDFTYETPSAKMRQTGVTSGTLLFNGTNQNGRYSGARHMYFPSIVASHCLMMCRALSKTMVLKLR